MTIVSETSHVHMIKFNTDSTNKNKKHIMDIGMYPGTDQCWRYNRRQLEEL